jgi:predicted O-linked N-acetylglucosamine transferase (SPINDLY family)
MAVPSDVGRNAPCPCGSGKRYKSCHGAPNAVPSPVADSDPSALLLRGYERQRTGDREAARSLYEAVLAQDPRHPDAWHLLALLELEAGRADAANEKVGRAIAVLPEHAPFHLTRGRILAAQRAWPEAISACERALELQPDLVEGWFLLGNARREEGNGAAAMAAYRSGLERDRRNAALWNNLGLALLDRKDNGVAEEAFRNALAADPALATARLNLAEALYAQSRFSEALPLFREAVELRPELAALWGKLADCQQRAGAFPDAIASCERAIALDPADARTQGNLGCVLYAMGRPGPAIPHLRRAVELDPSFLVARDLLWYCEHAVCDWSHHDALVERLEASAARGEGPALLPPISQYLSNSPEIQLACARRWAEQIPRPADVLMHRDPRGGRLRVGYVSSDFRAHAVAHLITELLERHDAARFEIFAYAIGPDDGSRERRRIAAAVEHWHEVEALSDEAIAKQIADDGIQLLVDLNGYTQYARTAIFAYRPAPVQMQWLGYLGTLGADCFDWMITDRFVTPTAEEANYSERLLCLPHCSTPVDTRREIAPRRPTRSECKLPEEGFVFCCFSGTYKLVPETFATWMRILRATPGSVLWLSPTDAAAANNLRRTAETHGVAAERLVFAERIPLADHLARLPCADLFLDTFPCSACTTCIDALMMGVPVLTRAGRTYASRKAASQVRAAGLPELVTESGEEYEALAIRLAHEPQRLQSLKQRLIAAPASAPLFDMRAFARSLEAVMLEAWDDYLSRRAQSA